MSTQLITIVRSTVLQNMEDGLNFTAIDISNSLKSRRLPTRYRDIAQTVRDMFESGLMEPFSYERRLTEVQVDGEMNIQVYEYFYIHADRNGSSSLPQIAESIWGYAGFVSI